ncbi:MAG TPA: family 43 glycosylhydrolase [Umezawaea sp.]|nr:family 43 glycosylhydrolase [Umezawaea sp.]
MTPINAVRRRRAALVLATTAALVGGTTSALPPAASAAVVDTNASYVLVNRHSGKALDVYDLATGDGARIAQYTRNDGAWQQWLPVKLAAGTFTNPIKRNGPDPWLQFHDGYYYLATTTWNSTITMRRSRTLAGLSTAADQTVFTLSGRPNGCCNMWAPEFHLLNGRWYLYYVAGQNVPDYNPTQRLHVLESSGTDPMGPYTFKADLGSTWELDPSILQHNGKLYLMGSAMDGTQSLTITPLSNPYTISGGRRTISQPTLAWERQTAPVNEGAEPLYRNGKTMIVYSASACWGPDYKLGLLTLTGTDPLNRAHWTKSANPVFQRNDGNGVFAPGHNGFFKSPDGTEDWIVYHANDSASGGCDMNRSTRAQRFTWNSDGTPNFGTPVRPGNPLTAPSGEPAS